MFNFFQRTPKASPAILIAPDDAGQRPDDETKTSSAPAPSNGHLANGTNGHAASIFDTRTSSGFDPDPSIFGLSDARKAMTLIASAKPRALFFIAAPRTTGHATAVRTLLAEQASQIPPGDAVAVVSSFDDRRPLSILRLPGPEANALAEGVTDAIEMLSVTLPAAFDSDSYKVARLALDEELRSGHDAAIDALKRRALSQNIGLLRTPLGYAIAPMHDGRVVAPDVFKALPEGLKAGVEAKLAGFEAELSAVLDNRTGLQQDYRTRLRDLDHEVASLTVRASLDKVTKAAAARQTVTDWLEALSADLVRNAALFVTASRRVDGFARAPVEIAHDPALARYRVQVLNLQQSAAPSIDHPDSLERASLCGVAHVPPPGVPLTPFSLVPGVLSRAGGGLVVVDARDVVADFGAWPLLNQVCKSGAAQPADAASPIARPAGMSVPFDARLILTGDLDDYRAFCAADPEGARAVRLIEAFDATIPLTPDVERAFSSMIAGIAAEEGLQPVEGAAMSVLMYERTTTTGDASMLSTDCDIVRDILILANHHARSQSRDITNASDIISALKRRARQDEQMALPGRIAQVSGR